MSENIDKPYVLYVAEIIYLEIFNINSNNLLINESYVETWAIILNIYCSLKENNQSNLNNYK